MSDQRIDSSKAATVDAGVAAAAVLLIVVGAWQIISGISALAKDEIYVAGFKYVWEFNLTTWGWIHLIIGIVALLVGIFIIVGARWAMYIGIVFAGISAVMNFMWIVYQPFWGLLVIAIDAFVIWVLVQRLAQRATVE